MEVFPATGGESGVYWCWYRISTRSRLPLIAGRELRTVDLTLDRSLRTVRGVVAR